MWYIHIHIYTYIYTYICICIYIYKYTYIGGTDVMKRTVKGGFLHGNVVEGPIDITQMTRPQIVMINCSFDSVSVRMYVLYVCMHV